MTSGKTMRGDSQVGCDALDVDLQRKHGALRGIIARHEKLAVAFSGGVDSTLLLAVAHEALGGNVLAVTGRSPSIPAREIAETRAFCEERGIRHVIVDTHEFDIPGFDRNPPDRCYICKKEIFSQLARAAAEAGMHVIAEGSNLDDEGDYRPGFKAVQEMGAISPLREAGFTKTDIRALACHLGLAAWDKPAFACLNSRFAYGDLITADRLAKVDAAEEAIRALGFAQVRVRLTGVEASDGNETLTARIEVPAADIGALAADATRERVVSALTGIGFTYVAVDLAGYRTGSMNATL